MIFRLCLTRAIAVSIKPPKATDSYRSLIGSVIQKHLPLPTSDSTP